MLSCPTLTLQHWPFSHAHHYLVSIILWWMTYADFAGWSTISQSSSLKCILFLSQMCSLIWIVSLEQCVNSVILTTMWWFKIVSLCGKMVQCTKSDLTELYYQGLCCFQLNGWRFWFRPSNKDYLFGSSKEWTQLSLWGDVGQIQLDSFLFFLLSCKYVSTFWRNIFLFCSS